MNKPDDWLDHPLFIAICIVAFLATIVISYHYPWGVAT